MLFKILRIGGRLKHPKDCINLQTDIRYNFQFGGIFMAKRKDIPQKADMRVFMNSYLKESGNKLKMGLMSIPLCGI